MKNRLISLKILICLPAIILFLNTRILAQSDLDVIKSGKDYWLNYSDAPNSLYHHLASQAYDLLAKREKAISEINSLAGWQSWQKKTKETLMDIVGPFPEKNPLNPKVVRILKKDTYRVEHIVFESQPQFYVTSSMFIPNGIKGKAPVVIYVSGHSDDGYRSAAYQQVIINLVKKNFIVFAFDPVGQGERYEYWDAKASKSTVGGPTKEHSYPGAQAFISGSSEARYMIWDGIRAVDYLLTRKEVDPARIGITGRSGGGTQSSYISAMDERIYAAAPECYLTNFTRLFETIGPQDAEQNMFNAIVRGIDHPDYLLVRAPKPALMITTTRDMFSIQGVRETEKEVARIYKAYGKEEFFGRTEDDAPHASTKKNREAMYAFFQKHLNNSGSPEDLEVTMLSKEETQVTTTGQVSTSLMGETVFSLNRRETEKLVAKLQASRADISKHTMEVVNAAKKLSGYQEPSENSEPFFAGRIQKESYVIEKYFTRGEGDYVIPYLLMIPDKKNNKALIYLHPSGKLTEASAGGEIEWFVKNGFTVLAPDLIGVGEMGPGNFKGDAFFEGISYNVWFLSMHLGRSIVGVRAGDVNRLVNLLTKTTGASEIYGFARQEMVPVLLHAAAFNPLITRVALIKPFSSYQTIVMNRLYSPSLIPATVPGALKAYDLADLAASLAPRKLMIADITDGMGNVPDPESIKEEGTVIINAYRFKQADGQLKIILNQEFEKKEDFYSEWIR